MENQKIMGLFNFAFLLGSCDENGIFEEDNYFGRFSYVTVNSEGREYNPEENYKTLVVTYNYTTEELDSILNSWGIKRELMP